MLCGANGSVRVDVVDFFQREKGAFDDNLIFGQDVFTKIHFSMAISFDRI
jgi:hypothetical protein